MTKHGLLFLSLILLTACGDRAAKSEDDSKIDNIDSSFRSSKYQQPADSVDVQYVPIYNSKTKSRSKFGPVFKVLLDSMLKYNRIRQLINDSSASIYILNELQNGADTTKKSFRVSNRNISAAICNFNKNGCYLQLKFDYSNRSMVVINRCDGQDSLQLYEWDNKNCW